MATFISPLQQRLFSLNSIDTRVSIKNIVENETLLYFPEAQSADISDVFEEIKMFYLG